MDQQALIDEAICANYMKLVEKIQLRYIILPPPIVVGAIKRIQEREILEIKKKYYGTIT